MFDNLHFANIVPLGIKCVCDFVCVSNYSEVIRYKRGLLCIDARFLTYILILNSLLLQLLQLFFFLRVCEE